MPGSEGRTTVQQAPTSGETELRAVPLLSAKKSSGASEYRLGYRSDIEGLRAVAILLVVADHAKVAWLGGGFVGVDIFFVLSGYLITALLVQDIHNSGRIHFARFYARRFRKLLPALLLMLVCVGVVTALLLAPGSQSTQAMAGASAALWSSNLRFAFSTFDYFGPDAASNLFLHTWSLGVEEQFYLIWPALLALLLGTWRSHDVDLNVRRLKIAMLALAVISLGLCVFWTHASPLLAFYMMPARAWQFALGALTLFYFGTPERADSEEQPRLTAPAAGRARIALRLAGWMGFALILIAAVAFNSDVPYPGLRALLPSVGAAALLAAGACAGDAGISRILSWRPMQALGRVSYSWYLWHWPVLLLCGALVIPDSALVRAGAVLVSLLIAMFTYRYVEASIRRNASLIRRPRLFVFGALVIMVAASALALDWDFAASGWANSPTQRRFADARTDAPIIYYSSMNCGDWVLNTNVQVCAFGQGSAQHTAVLMGDSLAGQWFPAVAKAFDKPGWRLFVLTKSACPLVDRPIYYKRIGREYVECGIWRKRALDYLATVKPDVVVLSSNPSYAFDRQQWIDGTSDVLNVISKGAGRIILLRATPHLPFNGPDCLSIKQWRPAFLVPYSGCSSAADPSQNANVYDWLGQAARRFNNVFTLDMNDLVCPGGVCSAERNHQIIFRDNQHLTATFARSLGVAMSRRMDARN